MNRALAAGAVACVAGGAFFLISAAFSFTEGLFVGGVLVLLGVVTLIVANRAAPRSRTADDRGQVISESRTTPQVPDTLQRSEPTQPELLLLAAIGPPDGAAVHGQEAWVNWRPVSIAPGRVLWRIKGALDYHIVDTSGRDIMAARLGPLEPNKTYEYVVEQANDGRVERSNVRSFTVRTGARFDPPTIERTVARDYDQSIELALFNDSAEDLTVAGRVLAEFVDLPADLVGAGSRDEPVQLGPHEKIDLQLVIHAADAQSQEYGLPVEAGGAFSTVRVLVPAPPLELTFEVVTGNPRTLAKSVRIRNNGATVPDLEVRIAPPEDVDVRLQPVANHAYLPSGEAIDIMAAPVLYLEFDSLKVQIECRGAGQSVRFPIEFVAPPGVRLMGMRTSSGYSSRANDHYCTNRPNTCCNCPGTYGNGPVTARA